MMLLWLAPAPIRALTSPHRKPTLAAIMKPSGPLKHFVIAFAIAAILYLSFYPWIQNRRTHNGPWSVQFRIETNVPTLVINEPRLSISNVKITFPGQSAPVADSALIFDQPQEPPFDVPFGQCIFEDLTFLPGTVVFKIYGHEIQLLPRVLTIDKKEYPWQSDTTLPLPPNQ
jgi:hypothetical protein